MFDRNVLHKRHRIRPVIVVSNYTREKRVVLEDQCLGLPRIPLWPGHLGSMTDVTIGIQVPGEQNDVVHQVGQFAEFLQRPKRVREIRRMELGVTS